MIIFRMKVASCVFAAVLVLFCALVLFRAPDGPSRLAGSARLAVSQWLYFYEPSRAEPCAESREPSRAEPLQNHTSRAEPSRARIANREYGTLHIPNIGLNMH